VDNHPASVARQALLASVPSKHQQLLLDSIVQIHCQREETARGGSSSTVEGAWYALVGAAKAAADSLIKAGLKSGAKNEAIASFVTEDLKHYLTAEMRSRYGPAANARHSTREAENCIATASVIAEPIAGSVRLARAEYDEARGNRFKQLMHWFLNHPVLAWVALLWVALSTLATTIQTLAGAGQAIKGWLP
jgi:hypothetical protein